MSDGYICINNGYDTGWHLNGKLHRDDGPAVEHTPYELDTYYNEGRLHRKDGTIIALDMINRQWFKHGKLHREDGPAIEWIGGKKVWALNGKVYQEEEDYYIELACLKNNDLYLLR